MKHVHLKVKGLLTLAAALTIIAMQPAISQTINNDVMAATAQLVSDYSAPITDVPIPANQKDVVSIFPNPVSGNMTIQSSQPIHLISIFDMLGREIKQFQPEQLQTKLNLQDLVPGKYFIRIQLAGMNSAIVRSFVKV